MLVYPGAFYLCALFLSKQVSSRDSEGDSKDTHAITQAQDGTVSPPTPALSMSMEGPGSDARTANRLGAGCAQNRIPSPSLATEPPLQGKSRALLWIPSAPMICRITLRQPLESSILHEPLFPHEGGGDPLSSAFKRLLVFL